MNTSLAPRDGSFPSLNTIFFALFNAAHPYKGSSLLPGGARPDLPFSVLFPPVFFSSPPAQGGQLGPPPVEGELPPLSRGFLSPQERLNPFSPPLPLSRHAAPYRTGPRHCIHRYSVPSYLSFQSSYEDDIRDHHASPDPSL